MPVFNVPSGQPYGGGVAPGNAGSVTPFLGVAAVQSYPSAYVGTGNCVYVLNAIATGSLSIYQLQNGTPTASPPYQFQPTDNLSLYYNHVA